MLKGSYIVKGIKNCKENKKLYEQNSLLSFLYFYQLRLKVRGCRQNDSRQVNEFWPLRFYHLLLAFMFCSRGAESTMRIGF